MQNKNFLNKLEEKVSKIINLSNEANLNEAAANLFTYLHDLDKLNLDKILIQKIPKEGIGLAINDRLERAAIKTDLKSVFRGKSFIGKEMFLGNFKSRYILALSLLATLSFTTFLINSKTIKSQSEYASIINISGRQRMLTQRITKELYIKENKNQLSQDIKDLEKYLNLLSDLESPLNKTLLDKQEIRNIFFNEEEPLHQKVIEFTSLVKNYTGKQITKKHINEASNKLLQEYEILTKTYENQGKKHLKRLLYIEIGVFLITLLILILEAIFIFCSS